MINLNTSNTCIIIITFQNKRVRCAVRTERNELSMASAARSSAFTPPMRYFLKPSGNIIMWANAENYYYFNLILRAHRILMKFPYLSAFNLCVPPRQSFVRWLHELLLKYIATHTRDIDVSWICFIKSARAVMCKQPQYAISLNSFKYELCDSAKLLWSFRIYIYNIRNCVCCQWLWWALMVESARIVWRNKNWRQIFQSDAMLCQTEAKIQSAI